MTEKTTEVLKKEIKAKIDYWKIDDQMEADENKTRIEKVEKSKGTAGSEIAKG